MTTRKTLFNVLHVALFVVAMSTSLWAQWPDYPTRGVPKKDGKPDLTAPTPRTADGKVDFTGLWEAGRGGGGGGRGAAGGGRGGAGGAGGAAPAGAAPAGAAPAGGAPAGGAPAPAGPSNAPRADAPPPVQASPDGTPPLATFFEIGANIKGGPPYTPWAKELRDGRAKANAKDNPDAHCLPIGLMQLHLHPQPRKIVQTQDVMIIMYEAQAEVRQVFLDGRPLPKNDPQPWWRGYSVGRWEGDTLVVETVGFRDDVWLDVNGSPLTETGKMTERFRRPNFGTVEIDITIEDPKSYTKPFTVRVNQRALLDTDLIEFVCNEGETSSKYYDK